MPLATIPRQLALALSHAESFAREDFVEAPANAAALAMIERWPDWPSRSVALVGPEGAGKSHLASIWAGMSGARFIAARGLGHADLPTALATGALVLEDAAPDDIEPSVLFHLLNLVREEGAWLLLTARSAPAGWSVGLRDLASRLREMPVVSLSAPDDALLRAVLLKLCADRQLPADDGLVSYLLSRLERSFAAMRDFIARLDSEALRQRRPVTRALAAELLHEQAELDLGDRPSHVMEQS
jgi:chromosomal replication initiation ATPase DnaA